MPCNSEPNFTLITLALQIVPVLTLYDVTHYNDVISALGSYVFRIESCTVMGTTAVILRIFPVNLAVIPRGWSHLLRGYRSNGTFVCGNTVVVKVCYL